MEHDTWGGVDLGSSFLVGNKLNHQNCANISFFLVIIIGVIVIILIIVQVNALLETLELTDSGQRKGHFALYNCLVLGHTKYSGVQRVYCNQFPAKPFYGSHRLDHIMIRPPGVDNRAFMISPDSVWYARVLLLFSATSQTDTGSKNIWLCTCFNTGSIWRSREHLLWLLWLLPLFYLWYIIVIIDVIVIMTIIELIECIYVGWMLLDLEFCMSSTTGTQFCISFQFRVSLENCLLYR